MSEEKKYVCSQAGARRLMKNVGAQLVSRESVEELQQFMEHKMKSVTEMAMKIAIDAKRTTIKKEDVELALKG